MSVSKFYGKHRGTVLNNIDPMGIGRIMASVPAVSALLPTSCFWGIEAELPTDATKASITNNPVSPSIVMQTTLQNRVIISDLPGPTGGIILKSLTGASITVNDTGIYIDNGKGASIMMVGPTITINKGALTIV
jgi:hypothetical protein